MAFTKTKSVSFATSPAIVRQVPDYMDTWALGETDPVPSQYEQDNAKALSEQSYSMALAMEANDSRRSTRSTYRPGPTPGLRSCLRKGAPAPPAPKPRKTFQFSQPAPVARAVTGYPNETRRKPVPVRAMSSMATPALAPRQHLLRATTNHQFTDFVGEENTARLGEDMQSRRASLHPFEALATKGLNSAKRFGLKAMTMAEQKLADRKK